MHELMGKVNRQTEHTHSSYHPSFFDVFFPYFDSCYDSWSGFECEIGDCVFCAQLSCRATSIVTVTLSETLSEKGNESGTVTSSLNALAPAREISISS